MLNWDVPSGPLGSANGDNLVSIFISAPVMEKNGQIKVDEYLQVEGYEDIYAIGDCCNTKDTKLAYTAGEQAKLVLKNLFNRKNGKSQTIWKGQ